MRDIPLDKFTTIKKERNKQKAAGQAACVQAYSEYDPDKPNNKITVMGNPSLGEVKTMIIGVRNISNAPKSGEVWVNDMRLKEFHNTGGWAHDGTLNMQLSDFATVNLAGKRMTDGFGGLEEGVAQRATDDYKTYRLTANFGLG